MLRERLAAAGLELVGGFVPMRFSDADGYDEDTAGAAPHARPVRRRRRRRRPAGAVRRGRARARREPGARRRGRRRCGSTTRAGGCSRPTSQRAADDGARARLRAGLPPPHLDLRRGAAARSSACSRTPTSRCCSTRATSLVAGGDPVTALRDWRERIGAVHIKDVRLDVLETRQGGARRHADRVAARAVLRARRGRRRPRRLLRRAHRRSGYDGWVVVEQDRVLDDRRRRSPARATSRWPTASGCASTPDGEPRRPHDGPDQRRRLPAADRGLAARGRAVRQVPRRQPDQRRGRRRAPRPHAPR